MLSTLLPVAELPGVRPFCLGAREGFGSTGSTAGTVTVQNCCGHTPPLCPSGALPVTRGGSGKGAGCPFSPPTAACAWPLHPWIPLGPSHELAEEPFQRGATGPGLELWPLPLPSVLDECAGGGCRVQTPLPLVPVGQPAAQRGSVMDGMRTPLQLYPLPPQGPLEIISSFLPFFPWGN